MALSRSGVAGLALVAVVAAAVWWFFPTDARRVRAACHRLADLASIPRHEPDIARVSRAAGLARLLASDVVVLDGAGAERLVGRDTIVAFAGRVAPARDVTVALGDVEVQVAGDGLTAAVRTTATVREWAATGSADSVEIFTLSMTWSRAEDGWQVARVSAEARGLQ